MRMPLSLVFGLLLGSSAAGAGTLALDDQLLELRAQTRACYLGFIRLYDAEYFRGAGTQRKPGRCVRVSYLREFSAEALAEATDKVFRERHGDAISERFVRELVQVGRAYQSVESGDRYTYCVAPDTAGVLLRDGRAVLRLQSADFAERFMQIWVRAEDPEARPLWAFGQC